MPPNMQTRSIHALALAIFQLAAPESAKRQRAPSARERQAPESGSGSELLMLSMELR